MQSSKPFKWDLEIVSKDNDQFLSKVTYNSSNFMYNGKIVSTNNRMSFLPDDLKVSDISIPGTHDSGTASLNNSQSTMSTQRYYIDELLNAGIRHLDIRTGLDRDKNLVRIVHDGKHALNHQGQDLSLEEAMGWIINFLNKNPEEVVIFQVKVDHEGADCGQETAKILKSYATGKGECIWSGDHVPTLSEVRGKILVISRIESDDIGGDHCFDIEKDGKMLQWAIDCDSYNDSGGKESKDHHAAHTVDGSNFDVWVQDNYSHDAPDKKRYIQRTLYGNESQNDDGDVYTNGTLYDWLF